MAALAAKHGADAFETSSQTGEGIHQLFECVVQRFGEERVQRETEESDSGTVRLTAAAPGEESESYCAGSGCLG